MKRICIAILLLAFVIAGCIYNIFYVSRAVANITEPLSQAAQSAQSGDLSAAHALTQRAQEQFRTREALLQCLINEKQLDEVRAGFARALSGASADDREGFLTELSGLRQEVTDLSHSEIVTVGNFF